MDRLISEKKVLDILPKYRLEESTIAEEIKAIPPAYKGMTNGEVHDMLYQMLVELKDGADRYGAEKWWNSTYDPQESEG